ADAEPRVLKPNRNGRRVSLTWPLLRAVRGLTGWRPAYPSSMIDPAVRPPDRAIAPAAVSIPSLLVRRVSKEDRTMRKIVANFFISLDGVVERPDQWHFPYFNDE